MNHHRGSVDHDSGSASIVGLGGVSLNKCRPLPEQWTLPHEWNIEKREIYANWKLDVQNQISNLSDKLNTSLNEFPEEEMREWPMNKQLEHLTTSRQFRAYPILGKMEKGVRR